MKLPAPAPLRDPETDFVWVIVPFSRPENLNIVLANFNRQNFPSKKLVIVENGRALGAAHGLHGGHSRYHNSALVLTSERHQSLAKNTALHEIRRLGGGFTVVMDDDDWYGPQFLAEACGYAKTHDVIGKNRHFVSVDGSMWLCNRETAKRKSAWLTGGTIACWAEHAPTYPMTKFGEDAEFCLLAQRQGMSIFGTDIYHYLYRRDSRTEHAWRMSSKKLRLHESACKAIDLGSENLSVVTGELLDVDGHTLLPTQGENHVAT